MGWLRDFSCLKAQCYKPADRAFLLERIREEWGSEAQFDRFVREDLLEVMVQSKRQPAPKSFLSCSRALFCALGRCRNSFGRAQSAWEVCLQGSNSTVGMLQTLPECPGTVLERFKGDFNTFGRSHCVRLCVVAARKHA